jgi:Tol biopolymer transport system component
MMRRRRLSILVLVAALAGCSAPAATTLTTVPAATIGTIALVEGPSVRPTVEATPSPFAVLAGEPWLVYHWYLPGKDTKDLFLARPDGSDVHAILTDLPGEHTGASWSPDGSRLAFNDRDDTHPSGSIWTAAADGSGAAFLTDGEGQCPDGIAHPNWSPDGSKLALICYPDPKGKQGSVATFDVATKTLTRLYTVAWPEHLDGPPSWSPDGTTLVFPILHWDPTDRFITGSLIATVPATGGKARRLTKFDTNMSSPAWSPDGSEIVMNSYDIGNMHTSSHPSNIYAIKPDGSGQRQVTRSSVDGSMRIVFPQWTPDGTWLLVSVATGPVTGPGPVTVDDVHPALVDPAGGEPVLFPPSIDGGGADLRPTP